MRIMVATKHIRDFIINSDEFQTAIPEGGYCSMRMLDLLKRPRQ